ncbi:9943_t:CDS:2, partial [Acaulospora colombiana]
TAGSTASQNLKNGRLGNHERNCDPLDMMERPKGALHWSKEHNSPFELSKVALMDFTLSPFKARDSTDIILDHTDGQRRRTLTRIKVTNAHRLLGVILDNKLRWGKQHEHVHAKATKWTALFKRLNHVSTGISLNLSRRLYIAVAIPRITYAADTWFVPSRTPTDAERNIGPVNLTTKLASIQRQAAITITGALRTTAGDAAEQPSHQATLSTLSSNALPNASSVDIEHPFTTFSIIPT